MDTASHLDNLGKLKRLQLQVQREIDFHRVKKDTVRAIARYFKLFIIAASALRGLRPFHAKSAVKEFFVNQ